MGDFDEKYGISLSRCHARSEDIYIYAPQLAKYAWPAAQKGCASYTQGLASPFCAFPTNVFNLLFHLIQNVLLKDVTLSDIMFIFAKSVNDFIIITLKYNFT